MAQIMCRGPRGIQLLHQGNHPRPPPPTEVHPHHQDQRHLVAYSTDGMCIAMARQGSSVITVLNPILGTPQQFINPDMEAQDIKIVDNSLFTVDRHQLVCWDLKPDGTVYVPHGTRRVAFEGALAIDPDAEHLTLSHNCSQIAFTRGQTVVLFDLRAPGLVTKYISANTVVDLQFSPDQHKLWLHLESKDDGMVASFWLVELEILECGGFGDAKTTPLEQLLSWTHLFSHGCYIEDCWVMDSGGKRLLWLPPSWRPVCGGSTVRWNGNLLALIDYEHPEPITIKLYP